MLKKSDAGARRGSPGGQLHDPRFEKLYPTLHQYLTQTAWEDGTVRELSSVLILPEPGVVRLMLRDRAMGVCCWVASPDLSTMLAVLDAAAGDPSHEWRVDRQAGQPAKRVGSNGQPLDRRQR
jgi:hypothetical protein